MVKHVLIFEVNLNGHHAIYLGKVAETYLDIGCDVTMIVSEVFASHPTLDRLRLCYGPTFSVVTLSETECTQAMQSRWGDVGREIAFWKIFQRTCRQVAAKRNVDFIFMPYLDFCLNAIGLLGSPFGKVKWGGICMRPAFHFKECGVLAPAPMLLKIKQVLFSRLLKFKSLKCLFSIDELLVRYVHERQALSVDKLRYLSDPAELPMSFDTTVLRTQFGIPANSKVVLVYGAIDERKGFFNLLDVLEATDELYDWHVMIVGKQSASARAVFASPRWSGLKKMQRIHAMDAFVTDEVEHQVLAVCDAVWVAYTGHYVMSGVLVRAGMYRKPVIACEAGLIGWYAKIRGVGVTTTGEMLSVKQALSVLSDQAQAQAIGELGYEQFKSHTWANFKIVLSAERCS